MTTTRFSWQKLPATNCAFKPSRVKVKLSIRAHSAAPKRPGRRNVNRGVEEHGRARICPSWDRRGNEPRNEASGVVLNGANVASLLLFPRSAPYRKTKDALSRDFNGGSLRSRS